jgi:hypothetical protein
MLRQLRKGQSTAEYAIVFGLVIAAAVAMQVYVKRSIQGKMKDAADYNDPAASMLTTRQYEPDYQSTQDMVSTRDAAETATTSQGGSITRAISGEDVSTRTGKTQILGTQ